MANNTYQSYLMKKSTDSGNTYSKLIDIKDYPDLGGSPEMLETTTLSDPMQTFTPGIKSSDAMEFNANYTKSDYSTLKALENQELDLAVWFGGTESGGTVRETDTRIDVYGPSNSSKGHSHDWYNHETKEYGHHD